MRVGANGIVRAQGFTAISDDDFARVVIAQGFAHEARWDPSGSSWLPFPFWLTGSLLKLFGTGLDTARTLAWCTSLLSVVGVFIGCRWAGLRQPWALAATCCFAALPHAVWLGLATVPEGYAAVLGLLAVTSLCRADNRVRLLGSLCLTAATLSRYELWPLVPLVAGFNIWDAYKAAAQQDSNDRGRSMLLAAGLCTLGPLAWLAHGQLNHGHPLFFLHRVAAYRQALDQAPQSWVDVLTNYPLALAIREPETTALALGALVLTLSKGRGYAREAFDLTRPTSRLLSGAAAVTAFLIAGDCMDGAPTHHPERALLVVWLTLLVLGFSQLASFSRKSVVTLVTAGAVVGLSRITLPDPAFVDRGNEVAIGELLGPKLAPKERLLVGTRHYGNLAVMAATARPWLVVGHAADDPRPSEDVWRSEATLGRFLKQHDIGWIAVHDGYWPVTARVATPTHTIGAFTIFRAGKPSSDVENSESTPE